MEIGLEKWAVNIWVRQRNYHLSSFRCMMKTNKLNEADSEDDEEHDEF